MTRVVMKFMDEVLIPYEFGAVPDLDPDLLAAWNTVAGASRRIGRVLRRHRGRVTGGPPFHRPRRARRRDAAPHPSHGHPHRSRRPLLGLDWRGAAAHGILTAADFALVESWPTGVSIVDGGVGLDIRSLDQGGKPIRNIYEHGWHPGTERVEAVLVFDVSHFDPGATLGIRDLIVQ